MPEEDIILNFDEGAFDGFDVRADMEGSSGKPDASITGIVEELNASTAGLVGLNLDGVPDDDPALDDDEDWKYAVSKLKTNRRKESRRFKKEKQEQLKLIQRNLTLEEEFFLAQFVLNLPRTRSEARKMVKVLSNSDQLNDKVRQKLRELDYEGAQTSRRYVVTIQRGIRELISGNLSSLFRRRSQKPKTIADPTIASAAFAKGAQTRPSSA